MIGVYFDNKGIATFGRREQSQICDLRYVL